MVSNFTDSLFISTMHNSFSLESYTGILLKKSPNPFKGH